MTEANEVYSKQVDFLWGIILARYQPALQRELAYETFCDLSDREEQAQSVQYSLLFFLNLRS